MSKLSLPKQRITVNYLLLYLLILLTWFMINTFKSIFKLFKFKEKNSLMTIAELKSFKLLEKKIEKEKRARAYISRINHKYNKMRLREKNFVSKSS